MGFFSPYLDRKNIIFPSAVLIIFFVLPHTELQKPYSQSVGKTGNLVIQWVHPQNKIFTTWQIEYGKQKKKNSEGLKKMPLTFPNGPNF